VKFSRPSDEHEPQRERMSLMAMDLRLDLERFGVDGDPLGEVDARGGSQEAAHLVGEGVARARHEDERRLAPRFRSIRTARPPSACFSRWMTPRSGM
jgi:hypothetical protein